MDTNTKMNNKHKQWTTNTKETTHKQQLGYTNNNNGPRWLINIQTQTIDNKHKQRTQTQTMDNKKQTQIIDNKHN